jgi:hypothetical protein
MDKCAISWIDANGKPTPDRNRAIGKVRTKARDYLVGGRLIRLAASDWFPICVEHAAQLKQTGMEIWEHDDAVGAVLRSEVRPVLAKAAGVAHSRGGVLVNPKAPIKTTNPLKHAFPHAKLKNITLTSINRLSKNTERLSLSLIQNQDLRNYSISRRAEYLAKFGGGK